MNNVNRDKIIELLQSVPADCTGNRGVGIIADYLIANDVIPVVRCKDCQHATFYKCKNDACYNHIRCEYQIGTDDENFSCIYGERKTETTKNGFNVGDICVYGSENQGNGSVNIVGITELRDDVISKIKVLKVITDNSGNNYFKYLLETGKEMYASNKYLRKLEPKEIEDLQIGV